ncbi:hypothetical protein HDU93_007940 [Gonapodya sp. JEL0774]|nr:hypothetical protein HDU93_007940 [Gonapodya sp. JEL0774]
MPLINIQSLRATLSRLFSRGPQPVDLPPNICAVCYTRTAEADSAHAGGTGTGGGGGGAGDTAAALAASAASAFGDSAASNEVHNPFVTNCGHVYCYYCVRSSILEDPEWRCLRCAVRVTEVTRVVEKVAVSLGDGEDPDVDENDGVAGEGVDGDPPPPYEYFNKAEPQR